MAASSMAAVKRSTSSRVVKMFGLHSDAGELAVHVARTDVDLVLALQKIC